MRRNRQNTWQPELARVIKEHWEIKEKFTSAAIYKKFEAHCSSLWSHGKTPENTVRYYLQQLRDDGFLRFVTRGTYERLK